jgi:predicted AAA+ superfamily ATPase
MEYKKRLIDAFVAKQLASAGAVLIRGPKGCGKTETARHFAKSEVRIDDSVMIKNAMESDPSILLEGQTPRLIDEWQEQPALWNTVRHTVDDRRQKGQFILTGSANPEETAKLHSGVGRFGILQMRPMSWFERGWSTGEVSLKKLLEGEIPKSQMIEINLADIAKKIVIGGWPGNIGLDEEEAILNMDNYFDLLTEVDLSRVSNTRRDPIKVRRLMQSLARNISTECSISTMAKDAGGADGPLSNDTVAEYLDALQRLMISEDLPTWNTHIRSSARLRKAQKRHFVDPSLATAALSIDSKKLLHDLEYFGTVFESLVIRDLRIYAQTLGAKIYEYRDSNGVEADAILEMRDGSWAAFEIKLGFGAVNTGIASLQKVAQTIDQERMGAPLALTVITAAGYAFRDKTGINVVPLAVLGA